MDIKVIGAVVGAVAATLAPAISYYFTKKQERSIARHNLKLDHPREFVDALAGVIDGESTDESQLRFSHSSYSMFLIASNDVLRAMQHYREEIISSNRNKLMKRMIGYCQG